MSATSSSGSTSSSIEITIFKHTTETIGVRRPVESWHKLFSVFEKAKPPASQEKRDLPGWSAATFRGDTRKKTNVECVYALVLDFDLGETTPETALAAWPGALACTYTSWSHTPEQPRFRLILPLARPATPAEYQRLWRVIHDKLTAVGQQVDVACKDPSRLWYLPVKRDEHFQVLIHDGNPIDPDELLAGVAVADHDDDRPIEAFEAFEPHPGYGKSALDRECEQVAGTGAGGRNTALNKAAFSLGQLVASNLIDEHDVVSGLQRAASACGLSDEEAHRTIECGLEAGKQQPRQLPERVHSTSRRRDGEEPPPWGEPRSLTAATVEIPPTPWRAALPAWLWQWVEAEAIATQTPEDLAAMLALTVLATCSQKRWVVRVKPGWSEPTCIYTAIVQPPGSRKSAVYRDATSDLYKWESEQREAIASEVAAANTTAAIAEKKLRAAEQRAGKSDSDGAYDDAMEAAKELTQAQDEIPVAPRLITSDATQEAVARLLGQHGGCISVMDAEGCGPVSLMLGRYSDGAAAVDVYLRGHAGDALRVDRVGRDPIIVDNPRVSMGITVQPTVVEQLSERVELRGLGLLARILWCHPTSNVGSRDVDPPSMPAEVERQYRLVIRRLLDAPVPTGDLHELLLSPEAWSELRDFMAELEPRLGDNGDLVGLADWASKLAGVVARIAGLLHVASHAGADDGLIAGNTVRAAILIGRYLLAHAQRILSGTDGSDPELPNARAILTVLERRGGCKITKRDLHQLVRKGHQGRFRDADSLDAPLAVLEEHGWIRTREQRDGAGKGRTSTIIEVNPILREHRQAQKPQKPQKVLEPQVDPAGVGAIEAIEPIEPLCPDHTTWIAEATPSVMVSTDHDDFTLEEPDQHYLERAMAELSF